MIKTMADDKGVDGEIPPTGFLLDLKYYDQLLGRSGSLPYKKAIKGLEFEEINGGPLETATNRKTTVRFADGSSQQFMVQTYEEGKQRSVLTKGSPGEEFIKYHQRKAEHSQFFERCRVKTPKLYDVQMREEQNGNGNPKRTVTFVYEFLEEPTTDLHCIALLQEMQTLRNKIAQDKFIEEKEETSIKERMKELSNLKRNIIESSIDTMVDLGATGMHRLRGVKSEEGLARLVQEHQLDLEDYWLKMVPHIEASLRWNFIKKGKVTLQQAREGIPKIEKSLTDRTLEEMAPHVGRIAYPLLDGEEKTYVHGDEYPHHFFIYGTTREGRVLSGLFDAGDAGMGRIEESMMRFLLSPLLSIPYEEIISFLEYGFGREATVAGKKTTERISRKPVKERINDAILIGIYEGLRSIGKNARRQICDKPYHDQFAEKQQPYFPTHINVSQQFITYERYNAGRMIESYITSAQEGISHAINKRQGIAQEDRRALERIGEYVEKLNKL